MKQTIVLLLLLLPSFIVAQPQHDQLDSLHSALENAANDTLRMDAYFNLALYYNATNNDSALYYHSLCLPISQRLNLKLIEAHILENQGFILTMIGNYPKALESFLKSQNISEDPASEKYVWNLTEGQTPREARLLTLTYLHMTMGHLYGRTNNRDKQISSYLQSNEIAKSIQERGAIITINMNLGNTYFNLDKLDTALFYALTAIDSLGKGDIGKYTGGIYRLAGSIYEKKGNYSQALDAYNTASKLFTEQHNIVGVAQINISLSNIYLVLNKPDSSLKFAYKGLETSKSIGAFPLIADSYNSLSSTYSKLNKTDSAYVYLQLASSLNDSLHVVEIKNLTSYQNLSFDEQMRLKELEEEKASFNTKIRTNTLLGSTFTLVVIAFFLFRNNKQKQKANAQLQEQKEEIQTTLEQLKSTQSQLIQSEKMASLGELTAGIAHEIQNPLNFVNNFSEVSNELIDEMNEELDQGEIEEAKSIAVDIKQNLEKINLHGQRASGIVKGMLEHSRTGDGKKEPTDINKLADEYLRLAYHGIRAKDKSFNADFQTDFDQSLAKLNVVPQDIGRVLLNLINNAFYAVASRKSNSDTEEAPSKSQESNAGANAPTVTVSTKTLDDLVEIKVKDNGSGISDEIKEKVFQPFFTTKPTGQGTGLGLSLVYDIIRAHGGTISLESTINEGTEFTIQLPNV